MQLMRGWFGGLRSKTLSPFSTACYATHSTQKRAPLSMLCTYGEHTSPPAHSLNLICIGKLLIINRGPHRKHFRWGQHSHPMLTRFFCLHDFACRSNAEKPLFRRRHCYQAVPFSLRIHLLPPTKLKITAVFPAQTPKKDTCRRHFSRTM